MNINIKQLHPNAKVPTYANPGDACFDLYAATVAGKEHIGQIVYEGAPVVCGTGLAFEVPEGQVMLVFSRSGHGFNHGLRLGNAVGVVDSDYRGEVKVRIHNDSSTDYTVGIGERIAQGMVQSAFRHPLELAVSLEDTARNNGGFGSTGAT